ncbi:helix-turn-helix domain-containing protein [Azospirillum sp.]|uniref:helix-turn-helix domain-containing protein n=1 Tax=Azospirillum sp. TaxID=34012 RepID=UPI003D755963
MTVNVKITEAVRMVAQKDAHRYLAAMITAAQIRAARAILGWKQTDLAERSGVSEMSVKNIERGASDPRGSTLAKLQSAFEAAGVQFLDPGQHSMSGGHGVRLLNQ